MNAAAEERRVWDGERIPPELWGKDHFSTLVYVESRNVDGDGQPIMAQMRTADGRPRRGKSGGRAPGGGAYPTRLIDGTELHDHDDWDCVDDMVAVGVINWQGTGAYPVLRLTRKGWRLASALRQHLATTGAAGQRTYAGFEVLVHLPAEPSAEEVAQSQQATAGHDYSKEELLAIAKEMDGLVSKFYWACFRAGMGTKCHPFLEFNGIMSKYVNLCTDAAHAGFAFPAASVHSSVALPMKQHDVAYFAEKFSCIFGPFFVAHPEMADYFCDVLVKGKHI